jgi:two-component system response regulator YesN
MWEVMIADDETIIRKGLRSLIEDNFKELKVVCEAEDGEIAYNNAIKYEPDILLVDICMPFIDGIQLIQKLNEKLYNSIIIVITGHDEFQYAQKAVRLEVFDYLLKPVRKEVFNSVIKRAIEKLNVNKSSNQYLNWAQNQLNKNGEYLKEKFVNDWLLGELSSEYIKEQKEYLNLKLADNSNVMIIKIIESIKQDKILSKWDRQLLCFAVKNIVEEILCNYTPNIVLQDRKENIVSVFCNDIKEKNHYYNIEKEISNSINKYLDREVIIHIKIIKKGLNELPQIYQELKKRVDKENNLTPIVLLCKKYIDNHYNEINLTLQQVADHLQISPSYISRLLRQELGITFIEYLTNVRTKKAIELMHNPSIKLYEIAELVGYSNQHYFSTSFKKVMKTSPNKYRKGISN